MMCAVARPPGDIPCEIRTEYMFVTFFAQLLQLLLLFSNKLIAKMQSVVTG